MHLKNFSDHSTHYIFRLLLFIFVRLISTWKTGRDVHPSYTTYLARFFLWIDTVYRNISNSYDIRKISNNFLRNKDLSFSFCKLIVIVVDLVHFWRSNSNIRCGTVLYLFLVLYFFIKTPGLGPPISEHIGQQCCLLTTDIQTPE